MKKSLTQRSRFKEGKTNYYSRKKLLRNYDKIIRVSLLKKTNYYCSSIIYTPEIEKPDVCKQYTESRWIQDATGKPLKANLADCFTFGTFFAKKLIKFYDENSTFIKNKTFVLSLHRSKKIIFSSFLIGVLSELVKNSAQELIEKFRWPKDLYNKKMDFGQIKKLLEQELPTKYNKYIIEQSQVDQYTYR